MWHRRRIALENICRPCYNKILKFKTFTEIFEMSTAQQKSVIRLKRCKSERDSHDQVVTAWSLQVLHNWVWIFVQ